MSERLEELLKESQLDQLDMVTLAVDPGPRTNPDMLVALQVPRNSYAASLPPSVVYRWVDKSLPDLDFNVEQQMISPPQGLRSNVRTLTSTVRTLLGPTPALILLLAQCSNTCQRCCWHTVRTHVRLRAEASQENRAILSKFERFWTSSWQNVAPKTSSTCSNASWACC